MDPLAQLQDIHMPEQIHNYPIALGWWISALLLVGFIIWAIIKYKKYRNKRVNQRQALKMLSTNDVNNKDILATLKWAALQYFPRQQIASLYGDNWLKFLRQNLPEKHQKQFSVLLNNSEVFSQVYQQNTSVDDNSLLPLAKYWLTHALPPQLSTRQNIPADINQGRKA